MSLNSPSTSDDEDDDYRRSNEPPPKWSSNQLFGVGRRRSAFYLYRPQTVRGIDDIVAEVITTTATVTVVAATTTTTASSAPITTTNTWNTASVSSPTTSSPKSTVLTNLQRGNTTATFCPSEVQLSFHELSGQGELTDEQVKVAVTSNTIDSADTYGFTALHWACHYGQFATVSKLLATEAVDVNKLAPDMLSPLILAAAGGHNDIVRLLIEHGANTTQADIVGNTSLMYAAAGEHAHTCYTLLTRNPNLDATNEYGDTAHSLAVQNGALLAQSVIEGYATLMLGLTS